MKIIQVIRSDDEVLIFTDNVNEDIKTFIDKYENKNSKIHLWYETPEIINYEFLQQNYPCVRLWYDYEYEQAREAEEYFKKLIVKI